MQAAMVLDGHYCRRSSFSDSRLEAKGFGNTQKYLTFVYGHMISFTFDRENVLLLFALHLAKLLATDISLCFLFLGF